jgi:hypothetical protein
MTTAAMPPGAVPLCRGVRLVCVLMLMDLPLIAELDVVHSAIGAFDFVAGSVANLIAFRMTPATRARLSFHLYAVPCLLMGAAVGHGLLFTMHLVGP